MFQQYIMNGLAAGTVYAFIAVSFFLIYSVTKFFNLAHGVVGVWGAYLCYSLHVLLGMPVWSSIPIAILLASALGAGMEVGVFYPLRKRGASSLSLLLASLGLYLVLESVLVMCYGNQTRVLRSGGAAASIAVWGARVTSVQLAMAATCLCAFLGTWLVLRFTAIGQSIRAVSADAELALIVGVRLRLVTIKCFVSGSGLVALASILVALDIDMKPTMGLGLLLPGIIAMIMGGSASVLGMLLGGLALGLLQHLGVWLVGAQWHDTIAFGLLVLFLVFHPFGPRVAWGQPVPA